MSSPNKISVADHVLGKLFGKRSLRPVFILFLSCLILTPAVQAAVYKWVDENGNVQFSDHPQGQGAKEIEIQQATPAPRSSSKGGVSRFKSHDDRLLEAIRAGEPIEVKHSIEDGADVAGHEGKSRPVYVAIAAQQGESLKVLLNYGADANKAADNGLSPLHMSARSGCAACATTLIDHGALVNAPDESGMTPLALAAKSGHAETAEVLLAHGAEVDYRDFNGLSPLFHAVDKAHPDVAALLLAQGADQRIRATNGLTLLMAAARNGDEATLQQLLQKGARVDARDNRGSTPLLEAVASGSVRCVQLLMEAGAKATERNAKGETALEIARSSFKLQLYPLLEPKQ